MLKLRKSELPSGHSKDDFECFGPPATKDGQFNGTMLADFGCFKQDESDTNKYYSACVCKSKINGNFYTYFEWGRTGQSNPDFQFQECSSQEEAQAAYEKQCHAKNDKRGEWFDHAALGRILRAKTGKDCYLVRPQATRVTGLPDARKICAGIPKKQTKKAATFKHAEVENLLRDLSVGTINYARTSFSGSALPTDDAIDRARKILAHAATAQGEELTQLTYDLYSLIPKVKSKHTVWELNNSTIKQWQDDLDAFEDALGNIDSDEQTLQLDFDLDYIPLSDKIGKYVLKFVNQATRNVHYNLSGRMNIRHIWRVNRPNKFEKQVERVAADNPRNNVFALHQISRDDLDSAQRDLYNQAYTCLMFHGTRSVNVGGILKKGLVLPKYLSGVSINGAMYGPAAYHADDWKKSAQYVSLSSGMYSRGYGALPNRRAFMFINDVALGKMHIASGPRGYTQPPSGHHSVAAIGGQSGVQNNEFMVYDSDQVNLRYLVEFDV